MTSTRNTQTEAKIRRAITKLLPSKGLAGITVSDICREAGINRGTFYSHYTDKFDLINRQVEALARDLSDIVLSDSANEPTSDGNSCQLFAKDRVIAALSYVRDNYDLISALTNGGSDTNLKDFVKNLIGELFEKSAATRGVELAFKHDDYGREMLLSGITSVFWLWLSKGCPETPEQITEIVWTHKSLSPEELASF